ncbi:MFS general substrate transporter [Leucogyrophana mollusca]|uniref:MFS general substrate transporter n=1 Tax=Leucogyrophana mollusca TaxID=85980 RepID=A0ACB8BLR1_9AGAM|nr:MFS general substrate transporter [Leucogyrophana mollusca]
MSTSIRGSECTDTTIPAPAVGLRPPTTEDAGFKEGAEKIQERTLPPILGSNADIPEGGVAAWSTAVGSFLVQFCCFGYTSSFGVYQDFFAQTYLTNESPSAISLFSYHALLLVHCCSWIGSLNAFLVVGGGLVAGQLYDRGYFYHLVIGGTLLQSFSLFMLSLAKPDRYYQAFLALGVGSGLAEGLLYVPSMAVLSHYFQKRRTLVMAFVACGSSIGSVVHPIMLNNLLNGPVGFANGIRASAGLVSGLLAIACLLMRTRLPPPQTPAHYFLAAKRCSRDLPFILATAGSAFGSVGIYFPLFYLQLDSATHGLSQSFSFYTLVILNASNFVGRSTSGIIAKYTKVPILMILSATGCSVLIFGMIGLSNIPKFIVLEIIYGYFAGVYIAMSAPLMPILTTDMSELGARMGIFFAITGLGNLIGSPINGALLTSQYHWWIPCVFSGVMSLAGAAFFTLMQVVIRRRKHTQETIPAPTKA